MTRRTITTVRGVPSRADIARRWRGAVAIVLVAALLLGARFEALRYSGDGAGQPFAPQSALAAKPAASSTMRNACFSVRNVGMNVYDFDLRLRVEWSDAPGSFTTTVVFRAEQ